MNAKRLDPSQTVLHPDAFVAKGAVVLGDVHIGAHASVWFGAIIRGDSDAVRIGERVNVQDGSVLHVDPGCPLTLEAGVSIGHNCTVHGCTIGAGTLVGMGSIVMNRVRVGEDCLIGAGSLLTEGKVFPPKMLIIGSPAKAVRPLTEIEIQSLRLATEHYAQAGKMYAAEGLAGTGRP